MSTSTRRNTGAVATKRRTRTPPAATAPAQAKAPAKRPAPAANAPSKPVAAPLAMAPQLQKPAAKPAKLPKAPKALKPERQRVKLVRDAFAMPEADFALIAVLKARAVDSKRPAKKSELLRAGLKALTGLTGPQLVAALDALTPVKTGRPKKGH